MNKIVLSALAALTIGTVAASASDVKFYTDSNGQVFTTAGEGRTEVSMPTPVKAKSSKLEFSGLHYLGYTYKSTSDLKVADVTANGVNVNTAGAVSPALSAKTGIKTGKFEMRRNYIQVKAHLFDDPKSYARVTMDYTNVSGYNQVIVKYAYIYLNDILPYTGVEFGQVHRPWIDYEEHQGWLYRSISKTLVEAKETADLSNSADLGVNFKTKTDYFTSEIGLFNGEGYHGATEGGDNTSASTGTGEGNSAEWRLTAAMLGNGKAHRHATKDTYFDASFWGQYNMKNATNTDANGDRQNYEIYGAHAVYNMPAFLLSAQYIKAENDNKDTYKKSGNGYSVNATARFGSKYEYEILARVDGWTAERKNYDNLRTNNYIYGVAWQQNKNVKWLLTGQTYVAKDHANLAGTETEDYTAGLLTAEVSW